MEDDQSVQSETPWWIIDPTKIYRQVWDFLICCLILFSSFAIPYRMTFERNPPPNILDRVSNAFFVGDLILNFFTAYEIVNEENGIKLHDVELEIQLSKIASKYLRSWFAVDFFASVPWDLVSNAFYAFRMLKVLRLLRMTRLLRVVQLLLLAKSKSLTRFLELNPTLTRIVGLFFLLTLITHYMVCFVKAVTLDEQDNEKNAIWLDLDNFEDLSLEHQYW